MERFEEEDGRSCWTCPGCTNKFDGFNTTKAKAHLLRLAGFSINVCHSWRKIDEAKPELLVAELHAKKESEADAKRQKKEQEAAGIAAAAAGAGGVLTAGARRSSASIGSAGGGSGSRDSFTFTPPATAAFASQSSATLTMAITDFIHAEGLPFAVVESPRLALIVKLAKNAPLAYRPPDRKAVGGRLLDYLNYTQAKSKTMTRLYANNHQHCRCHGMCGGFGVRYNKRKRPKPG